MPEDLSRIRSFVEGLTRREQALLLLRVAGQLAVLGAVVAAWLILAAWMRWDRAAVVLGVVLLGGVGGWYAAGAPLWLRWRHAGDRQRQARLVEALAPSLQGRLSTAVERVGPGAAPVGQESPAILALVAKRAAAAIVDVHPATVHPSRPSVRRVVMGAVAWGLVFVLSLAAPGGPLGVLRWWIGGSAMVAALEATMGGMAEPEARVGDLVLRYRYPAYTGLEDKVVPNSTGDVQAPPGTTVEVTARSAEPMEAAGLEAYERRLDARVDAEGRQVSARFSVTDQEGVYRLLLYRGGEPEVSRAYRIEPQPDLPPDVTIDVGVEGAVELALDDLLRIDWRARDDFGIEKVILQIEGADVGPALYQMVDRRAEVFDLHTTTPAELGLRPGDRVQLRVVAWDNDTISGSKVGESAPVEVVVLGARGLDRRAARRQAELMALMLPVLAGHLTDPWPPGGAEGSPMGRDTTSGEMAAYGEAIAGRYQDLFQAVEASWSGMLRDQLDATLMDKVTHTGTELIRYTQVAFEPGSEELPKDAAFEVSAELRDEAIVALEEAILAFHRMQRGRAMEQVKEMADNLDKMAAALEEQLQQDDPDLQEMMARLDQLQRMMEELMNAASQLEDGGLREFINQRQGELNDLMEQVREALARGDKEEAQQLMERLAEQIQQMAEGIREDMSRRQGEQSDALEQADQLADELEQLAQRQDELQEQTRQLQEEEGGEQAQQAAELWEKLEKLAEEHAAAAEAYEQGINDAKRPFWEQSRVDRAADDSQRLRNGVVARDLRGARASLESAEIDWSAAEVAMQRSLSEGVSEGPGRAAVAALRQQLQRIRDLLEQLEETTSQSSPEMQQRAQQLQDQQRQLQNELQQAQEQARQLQRDMPVQPQGMEEALEEAGERMESASEDLGQGQPMQAEGEQGVASQRLRDAKKSLEQAAQQARQQSQGSGGQEGGEQGEGEGERDGTDGNNRRAELEIPTREEFRTPEEYRRALLEGMEGDVPEEYRAMKKRYYEELVHQ